MCVYVNKDNILRLYSLRDLWLRSRDIELVEYSLMKIDFLKMPSGRVLRPQRIFFNSLHWRES